MVGSLMGVSGIIPCRGLATDGNATAPPTGALRRCENAIIDAPGVASARPNFNVPFSKTSTKEVHRVFAHDGAIYALTYDSGGPTWALEKSASVLTGGATPTDTTRSNMQVAKVRANAYFATDSGVRKISTSSDTATADAGMHEPITPTLSIGGSGTWLAVNDYVAYRIIFVKRDANDVETRSAPTPWASVQNTTAGADGVNVFVPLPSYVTAGDTLEIYRSKTVTTSPPSDVLYLSARYTITSADVTAESVTIEDALPTAMLGELLYTSSVREGIEGANLRPPRCLALAAWQDSLWCGSTRAPHTLVVDLVSIWDPPPSSVANCTVTTGVNTLTLPAPQSDVRVGQLLWNDTLSAFPAGTKVTNVAGATLTVSNNALITSAVADLGFADTVTIDGVEYYGRVGATTPSSRFYAVTTSGSADSNAIRTARALAYAVSAYSGSTLYVQVVEEASTAVTGRPARIVFQRTDLSDDTAFTFDAGSIPDASWEAYSGSFTSEQETKPNRIAFSKPLEPEHFRLFDWIEMGREDAHVLAFAPLSGGMLVFKEDGIWSVYGNWPLFSVDKVSDARLVRGDAVSVLDDRAYAWTDRGVLEMGDRGVLEDITAGRIRDELVALKDEYDASDSSQAGAWVVRWPRMSLVLVGANSDDSPRIYVFHLLTREWSMWPIDGTRAAPWIGPWYDIEGERVLYGRQGPAKIEVRSSISGTPRGYDTSYSITTWSIAGTTITVATANLGEWDPKAGDFVSSSDGAARVLAVEVSGSNHLITVDQAIGATGNLNGFEGAPAVIEWQRHGVSPASVGGFIREMQVHLDVSDYSASGPSFDAMRIVAGASSDRSSTASTLTATPAFETAYTRPLRFGVPRAVARSAHLYPYLEISELIRWRVNGIALVGDGVSERVRQ
jgi:hypothetical protein